MPVGTVSENAQAGSDNLLPVLPTARSLSGIFAPTKPDRDWLRIESVSGGVIKVSFSGNTSTAARTARFHVLGQTITVTQQPALDTGELFEGPAAAPISSLSISPAIGKRRRTFRGCASATMGAGEGVARFTFDANPGPIRFGTLTIAGQTVTVTQAGTNYVAASSLTSLVSSQLIDPTAVATDGLGDVVFADSSHNAVKEWNAATQTVSTLVSSGLNDPRGVAVDGSGNVYIADSKDKRIKEWVAKTGKLITLVGNGLNHPDGVAVDNSGNVYIADTGNDMIKKWHVTTHAVTTLVHTGLNGPQGVAVDGSGNVYIADTRDNAIKRWSPRTREPSPR